MEIKFSKELSAGILFLVGMAAICAPFLIAQAGDPRLFWESLLTAKTAGLEAIGLVVLGMAQAVAVRD